MLHNEAAIRQVLRAAIAEAVCVALMLGVYALLGNFTLEVFLGGVFGYAMAVGNFLALSITVSGAADRAEKTGDAARAAGAVQLSSTVRLLVLLVVYIIILKATTLDPLASLLPLIFMQLSIRVVEYFRKEDEPKK